MQSKLAREARRALVAASRKLKAFAGGPVDLLDASHAIEAAGGSLDQQLLRRLAAGYGRDAAAVVESLLNTQAG
jgi:hypothetical protein